MGWIAFVILQSYFAIAGYRHAKRAGQWSWSLFFFAIVFCVVDGLILVLPAFYLSNHSPYLGWAFAGSGIIAAGNFVWFIMVCRRWRLPDGRTNLEADREEKVALKAQQITRPELPDLGNK